MNCPHCQSTTTSHYQKRTSLGYPVFRCHRCKVTFNERTGTIFNELPRSKLRGISSVEANIIRRGKPRGIRPD